MKVFLQSIDFEFWFIVNLDPYETTLLDSNTGKNGSITRNELSAQDKLILL